MSACSQNCHQHRVQCDSYQTYRNCQNQSRVHIKTGGQNKSGTQNASRTGVCRGSSAGSNPSQVNHVDLRTNHRALQRFSEYQAYQEACNQRFAEYEIASCEGIVTNPVNYTAQKCLK